MTLKIEPFFEYDTKNWTFFLIWLKELNIVLNLLFEHASMVWASFSMWQRNWNFSNDSKNRTYFLQDSKNWPFWHDSKNWIFFLNMIHRIEPFSKIWLQELNMTQRIVFFNLTSRIEPLFLIWLKELNTFFWYDSQKWTLFSETTLRIEPFWKSMTQRIQPTRRLKPSFLKKKIDLQE